MKKLLILGMAVLTACAGFTGCSKSADVYDPGTKDKEKEQQVINLRNAYSNAFVQQFGNIASNQTWGFGKAKTSRSVSRGAVNDPSSLTGYAMPTNAAYVAEFNNFNKYVDAIYAKFKNADKSQFLTVQDLLDKGVNLENYYLQHVYKGKNKGNTGAQHKDFQYLYAYNYKTGAYEEVLDFEKGKNNKEFYNGANVVVKGVTFMLDMGTPDETKEMMFAWAPKKGTDGGVSDARFSKYAILEIEGDYYIGFDYTNVWNKKEYDFTGDFTGWIIRIAKAEPTTTPPPADPIQARIFCEDMGSIGDFDFNDVVFDAVAKTNGDIDITVLASGASYGISIDGVAVTMGKMTNTGVKEAPVQKFTIKAVNGQPKYANFGDIPITVNPGGDALPYNLEAPAGKAPQKICTYVGVDWADEYVSIERAYNGFKTWVNTATPETWSANQVEDLTDLDLTNN